MSSRFVELTHEQLDALIARVEQAVAKGIALAQEDLQLLLNVLRMLVELQSKLSDTDVTLHKLRKLAGIVASSEKLTDLQAGRAKKTSAPKRPSRAKSPPPNSAAITIWRV